jgi:hypothetical protein
LCCLSKLNEWTFVLIIKWLVLCVVWVKWLNRFDCMLNIKWLWLFLLYERLDLGVWATLWASQLNGLTFVFFDSTFESYDWIDLTVLLNVKWLFLLYVKQLDFCVVWANWMNGLLCSSLNDLYFMLFEQVDWMDWLLCCLSKMIE